MKECILPPRAKPGKSKAISRFFFYWFAGLVLFGPFEFVWDLANRVVCLEYFIWNGSGSCFWSSLCSWWESPIGVQPHLHSSRELASGRLGYNSYVCSVHLCSSWGTSQSIQSIPLNRSSVSWSSRKVTQVNDQIIFGQPHDTTWFWRMYSALGRNKLA